MKGKIKFSQSKRPMSAVPKIKEVEDTNDPDVLMLFIKYSCFRHYFAGQIISMLLDCDDDNDRFELLGIKVVNYKDTNRFSPDMKNLTKTLFYKFYENNYFGDIKPKIK
jgi:hypothetical protein